jgi:hypothetical protein
MFQDTRSTFADKLALPASAGGPTAFGSQIDLTAGMGFNYQNGAVMATANNTLDQPGNSDDLYIVGMFTTVPAVLTSIQWQLRSDTNVNLTTSPTIHYDSGVLALATMVAAFNANQPLFAFQLPRGDYKRYLGIATTTVGAGGTGAISIFLTTEPKTWFAAADAIV